MAKRGSSASTNPVSASNGRLASRTSPPKVKNKGFALVAPCSAADVSVDPLRLFALVSRACAQHQVVGNSRQPVVCRPAHRGQKSVHACARCRALPTIRRETVHESAAPVRLEILDGGTALCRHAVSGVGRKICAVATCTKVKRPIRSGLNSSSRFAAQPLHNALGVIQAFDTDAEFDI